MVDPMGRASISEMYERVKNTIKETVDNLMEPSYAGPGGGGGSGGAGGAGRAAPTVTPSEVAKNAAADVAKQTAMAAATAFYSGGQNGVDKPEKKSKSSGSKSRASDYIDSEMGFGVSAGTTTTMTSSGAGAMGGVWGAIAAVAVTIARPYVQDYFSNNSVPDVVDDVCSLSPITYLLNNALFKKPSVAQRPPQAISGNPSSTPAMPPPDNKNDPNNPQNKKKPGRKQEPDKQSPEDKRRTEFLENAIKQIRRMFVEGSERKGLESRTGTPPQYHPGGQ